MSNERAMFSVSDSKVISEVNERSQINEEI